MTLLPRRLPVTDRTHVGSQVSNPELKSSWKTGELQAPILSLIITVVTMYFGVSESEAVQMVSSFVLGCITLAGLVSFVLGRHGVKISWIEYLKTLPPPAPKPGPAASARPSIRIRREDQLSDIAEQIAELRRQIESIPKPDASPPGAAA